MLRHTGKQARCPYLLVYGCGGSFRGEQLPSLCSCGLDNPAQVSGKHGQGMATEADQHHGKETCQHNTG